MKLVHDPDISTNVKEYNFMLSGHSFLPHDYELGLTKSASKKVQHIYKPEN